MRKNIHITPSRFHNASRILKQTKSIDSFGVFDEIVIVALGDDVLPEHEKIDNHRRVWRVPLSTFGLPPWKIRGVFRYIQWMVKVVFYLCKSKVDMINCHSIMDLHLGVILKKIHHCKLIYDTHELETERNGMHGITKKIAKQLEKKLIKHADHVFVVSDSIEKWYKEKYKLSNITTIKNVPFSAKISSATPSNLMRKEFNIPANDIIYIYQGGFFPGRGIRLILSVFENLSHDKHIVFMGYGALEGEIVRSAETYKNIHFLKAVSPEKVLDYSGSADVGLSIIQNICISYYYCSPNKLFEYALSGIPCIVSNFPDMGNFVDKYKCGWKTEVNAEALYNLINVISKEDILKKKINAKKTPQFIGWQFEEEKMLKVYRPLLKAYTGGKDRMKATNY